MKQLIILFSLAVSMFSSFAFSQKNFFSDVDHGYGIAVTLSGHKIYYTSSQTMLQKDNEKQIYIVRSEEKNERKDSLFSFHDGLNTQFHFLLLSPEERDMLALEHGGKGCGHLQLLDDDSYPVETTSQEFHMLGGHVPGVAALLDGVDYSRISRDILILEKMPTRFHTTESGLATPQVIYDIVRALDANIDIRLIEHEHTKQKSVVVKMPGITSPEQVVIFGSHLDSINSRGGSAPGADDDASGVAVLIEMIRVVREQNIQFHKTIEWHFYAAEEVGLIGSSDIAKNYAQKNIDVIGMVQFDMLAWSPDEKIFLIETDTDEDFTQGLGKILNLYRIANYEFAKLSAGTSDHKSWSSQGYSVAFPFENPLDFNPGWHSEDDVVDKMINPQMSSRYAQLALGVGVHYAGLVVTPSRNNSKDLFFAATPEAFLVSVSSDVQSVYACKSQNGRSCDLDFFQLDFLQNSSHRKVYYSTGLDIKISQKWLVWSLGEKEIPISSRWVSFSTKN